MQRWRNAGVLSDKDDEDEENEEEDAPEKSYNYEIVEDEDYIRNEVAAGNKQFLTGLFTDIYTEFQNSSVKDEHGNTAGMIYTAVTFVPNPYENNTIVELIRWLCQLLYIPYSYVHLRGIC